MFRYYCLILISAFGILSLPAKAFEADQRFYYEEEDYIAYSVKGSGTQHVLFLHGFGASSASWTDIAERMDTTQYKLFLVDFKGFGKSSLPKDGKYSVQDQALIIQQFAQMHLDSNFYLFGHSMGGGIALFLTTQKMLSPQKLILLDCAAYNWDTPFFIAGLRIFPINYMAYWFTTSRMLSAIGLKFVVHKDNYDSRIIDRYTEIIRGKGKAYTHIKAARQINPPNYEEVIAAYENIQVPTLILWGAEDKILSPAQGLELQRQIPGAKLHMIERCGHVPHEELPDITFALISPFLAQ